MSDAIAFHTSSMRRVANVLRGAGATAADIDMAPLVNESWAIPPLIYYLSRRAVMGPGLLAGATARPSVTNLAWLAGSAASSQRPAAAFHALIDGRLASERQGWKALRMWAPLRSYQDEALGISDALAIALGLAVAASQLFNTTVEFDGNSYVAVSNYDTTARLGVAKGYILGTTVEVGNPGLTKEAISAYLNAPRYLHAATVWPAVRQIRNVLETLNGIPADTRLELDAIVGAFGAMYRRPYGSANKLSNDEETINGHIKARFISFLTSGMATGPTLGMRKAEARAKVTAITEAVDFVNVSGTIPARNLITGLYAMLVPSVSTKREILNAAYGGTIGNAAGVPLEPMDPMARDNLLAFLSTFLSEAQADLQSLENAE